MFRPKREPTNSGQESVWDYPRPPKLEPVSEHIHIKHCGQVIADTNGAYRVLETSHPPTYFLPPTDCSMQWLTPSGHESFCEWKGVAGYYDLVLPNQPIVTQVAWFYTNPTAAFKPIAGYLAFYCGKVDECFVGAEQASPQPGSFYGGWVTSKLAGPFKGVPGSMGW